MIMIHNYFVSFWIYMISKTILFKTEIRFVHSTGFFFRHPLVRSDVLEKYVLTVWRGLGTRMWTQNIRRIDVFCFAAPKES